MPHEYSAKIKQHGSLPWDSTHMVPGGGYDIATHESLPSAFDSVDVEDNYSADTFPQVDVQAQVFRNAYELTDSLWPLATASYSSLSAATVKTLAPYIRTAKCNSNNACLVLRCTLSMPPEHFDSELDLTDEARELLQSSPDKFTKSYGEYCVAGQIRESSFFALCTYSSTNTAELVTFTSKLNATGSTEKPGIDVATDLTKDTESHGSSIKESHRFHISGVEGEVGLSWLNNATVTEAWQGFRVDYKPVPQVALLKHYSSVLPGQIERPTSHQHTSCNITEAMWKGALLEMTARSATAQPSSTITTIEALNQRLDKSSSSQEAISDSEMTAILSKFDALRVQLQNARGPVIKMALEAVAEKDKERCVE